VPEHLNVKDFLNSGLDQYGAESFKQQQFGTAGVEGVNTDFSALLGKAHWVQMSEPQYCSD